MSGAEKLIRRAFPTKARQLAYHKALEDVCREREAPMKVVKFMGRWEIRWERKK